MTEPVYIKNLTAKDNNMKIRCRVTNQFFYDIIDYGDIDTAGYSNYSILNVTCKYAFACIFYKTLKIYKD